MSPRPDVSEERRNQILEAASRIFAKSGFYEARMDDIAEEADLSKGTLYWYFKSKDEIIIAIFERLFERECADLRALHVASGSASERLLAFSERAIGDIRNILNLMPIMYEFVALAFRRELVQDAFRRFLKNYLDALVPIVQQGVDGGEFRAVDAQEVAIAVGAIFEGTILLWAYDPDKVDIEKNIRASVRLLMGGLKA
ncbi:MAG: TetR/AcrR family transcriptional regulator [Chloroflexota bacterium]